MTELFEDNQRDLERAVENLGYLLEQNPDAESIAKLRQDITNQSAYVQKRHDILMDDTLKGYLEVRPSIYSFIRTLTRSLSDDGNPLWTCRRSWFLIPYNIIYVLFSRMFRSIIISPYVCL